MLDLSTDRGRAIDAALRLAETRAWRTVTFADISAASGVGFPALQREFKRGKMELLTGFSRAADAAAIAAAPPPGQGQHRDRLFDVLMARFEAMAPYRLALARIAQDMAFDPLGSAALAAPAARSAFWLLQAAGIPASGTEAYRIAGLLGVNARATRAWLADDDAGLGRTMAALDAALRRAARNDERIARLCSAKRSIARALFGRRSENSPGWRAPSWSARDAQGDDPRPADDTGLGPAPISGTPA